ncbi:hypothetical protein C8F04DRAFT_1267344 [Mycena alexandri]|uniref:Uncharacterized protein n=1 Tax=Mycena alexandri TaxID=1745969 RepID=A0AAD6WXN7_9AGAR|nr:hypothetical protein C8F04DRAFT_1267344 [Mycena alexandri]
MALLYNHLRDARIEWNRHQPQGGETEDEAEARAAAYNEKRRLKTVQSSRKSNKLNMRKKVAQKMVKLCFAKKDEEGVAAWTWFLKLLTELGNAGMSSEESEVGDMPTNSGALASVVVFAIRRCPWRLAMVNKYMEQIDEAALVVLTSGHSKHARVRTEQESEKFPPSGLPRAMYNPAWLTVQKTFLPDIEEILNFSEGSFTMMEVEVVIPGVN